MRRDRHRHAAVPVQRGQERCDVELLAEIQRRGRLVEQEDVGRLRQCRGDDNPLLLAAAERVEPRASRWPCPWRPAPRARLRNRPAPRPRTGRDADGVPSAPSRARCIQRRARSPAEPPRGGVRYRAGSGGPVVSPPRRTVPDEGARVPLSRRSSDVLPDPFGPEQTDEVPLLDGERDPVDDERRSRVISEGDVIGLQQYGLPDRRSGPGSGSRGFLRTRYRTG